MKSIKRKIAVFLLVLSVLVSCIPTAAWGGIDPPVISGRGVCGARVIGDDCPIELKSEKLIFDIPSFPYNEFSTATEPPEKNATVTAKYELYNPTDSNQTVALAIPIGNHQKNGTTDRSDNYTVTVNGAPVSFKTRHTYSGDVTYMADRIRSEKVTGGLYSPSTSVSIYEFRLAKAQKGSYVQFTLPGIDTDRKILTEARWSCSRTNQESVITVDVPLNQSEEDHIFRLICIGDRLPDHALNAEYHKGSSDDKRRPVEPAILMSETVLTLDKLIMQYYDTECGVSENDWYNAVTDYLGSTTLPCLERLPNLHSGLMTWYCYELSASPGETVENQITASIIPSTHGGFEPPTYDYSFRRAPSEDWAGFGKLEIEIITPFYVIEQFDTPEYQKNDNGYTVSLDGSRDRLYFTLSEDSSPKETWDDFFDFFIIAAIVLLVIIAAIPVAAIVCVAVIIVKYRKKRRTE